MEIIGIVGRKNSGKTGLVERLVAELGRRAYSVSTIKQAGPAVDIDQPGRDSFRHRNAGAHQVILASEARWALMTELRDTNVPSVTDLVEHLAPVDVVLVEGFKLEAHAKLEVHRRATGRALIAETDPTIRAVASDSRDLGTDLPVLDLNDTTRIAEFLLRQIYDQERKSAWR